MINEMQNFVQVEGLLSEIGLEEATYTQDGKEVECIRGDVKIHVETEIVQGGDTVELEIPVRFFTKKYTNAGNENPSYTNLYSILKNGKSIAAVGADEADAVRIGSGRIVMQEYYTPDGRLVTFPSVSASFVNVVKRADMKYKAKADFQAVIGRMEMEVDKDGVETDTMKISAITVGYNEYVDVLPVLTKNEKFISALKSTYGEGDLVKFGVRLNFSSRTIVTYEEATIGEPIEHERTVQVSDLVLSSVLPTELGGDEITVDEINRLLSSRTARLEKRKEQSEKKGARSKNNDKAKVHLGF